MMLRTKVGIHVFSAVEKIFFDIISLENIISDMSQTSRKTFCVNPYIGYDFV